MVHYSKVLSGLTAFVDQDLIQKMNGSWKAWGLGTVVGLIAAKGPEVFEKLRENTLVNALGLIDGEMIDVDTIYSELLKQAQARSATIAIPVIGSVTYSAQDVEQLYRCIIG